jgi:bisphosphoglycerate-independent phosphoglycerate mutase (AlkP superfamily)
MIVTADNCGETMIDPETGRDTTARAEPVPVALVGDQLKKCATSRDGRLADLAPTSSMI